MSATYGLRLGDYRDVLANVGEVDAVITDPPYGERTHRGHDDGARGHLGDGKDDATRRAISYKAWTPAEVAEFVTSWHPRCRGWFAVWSCHTLQRVCQRELERAGRYVFAPLPCVIRGMTVRLGGDGPSSWTVWLTVARPSTREFARWGTLPGAYVARRGGSKYIGGKPLPIVAAVVRDYSRPGDLVCDPCAGLATTAVAALASGRRFVGSEIDPIAFERASARLRSGVQQDMFAGVA